MADTELQETEVPNDTAGAQLKRAREAAGLSLADIAARTKIAERHLKSIEDGNYAALASRTYAVGFTRNYARALELDDKPIVQAVREELGLSGHYEDRAGGATFEPGDPARVPSARVALLAGLAGLLVVLAGYYFWRTHYVPAANLPSLVQDEAPKAAASQVAAPAAVAPPQGAVVFTALEQGVWVKFYDGSGKQLMQKQLTQGESYTVPADAVEPKVWTGRPEALSITIGGRSVPKLSEVQVTMKDVPVTVAALLARPAPVPAPVAPALAPVANPSTVSR